MTAAAANRDTVEQAGPIASDVIVALAYPMAAATTIFAGTLVALDSAGNAVPATASTAVRVVGRAEKQVVNTVAAGFGNAGQLTIEARPGVFAFNNGDSITAADVGSMAYASDDNTVNKGASAAGVARPTVGPIYGLYGTQVKVGVGPIFGAFDGGDGAGDTAPLGTLAAFAAGTITPSAAALTSGAIYDVPTTAANSTIVLPAASAVGTVVKFCADGTKNGHTVQYIDATGSVAITTALTASKRHLVECVKESATIWVANAYVSP